MSLVPILVAPHSEDEYRELVQALDLLIDRVGEDESQPLASLMEAIGVQIEKYEDDNVPEISTLEED
jgi:HTH-type transcriptional regulator/antitoxin HigA